jgi:hypothetical protein
MDDVIKELGTINEDEVYIVDDDFLYDVHRLETFMDGLVKEKINKKFLVYGRADFIAKNKEVMIKLKKHGFSISI